MILAHKITLDPTKAQEAYFRQACGVARHAYNWAVSEAEKARAEGRKVTPNSLKKEYNAKRKVDFIWSLEVTKCASGHAFTNFAMARKNMFDDIKKYQAGKIKRKDIRTPTFKKKGKKDSFALWNDQFKVDGKRIRIPHIGWVKMREALRFEGKIMGAMVSRTADKWFVAIQVEMPDNAAEHARPGSIVGIDLGVSTLMTLSRPIDGVTEIANPKARKAYKKRMTKLQRRISRQEIVRSKAKAKRSKRQAKRQMQLSKLHYRIVCVRKDAAHKATTKIANHFETVCLEDLNVIGMTKNHCLAGAVLDSNFGEIRRQQEYKAEMRGGNVVFIDRYWPSSKACSVCGCVTEKIAKGMKGLSTRSWTCAECGTEHDRDGNASTNIELVGKAIPKPPRRSAVATHGEISALAVPSGTTKLESLNRELNSAHV